MSLSSLSLSISINRLTASLLGISAVPLLVKTSGGSDISVSTTVAASTGLTYVVSSTVLGSSGTAYVPV
jgi:hypothetical protein